MAITVSPESFSMVLFDNGAIAGATRQVAARLGWPDELDICVEVNEAMPLARVQVRSVDPLVIDVEGGAFEDPRRPRQLSEELVATTMGRVLCQVMDRRTPGFGDPGDHTTLLLAHRVAWDTYAYGRLERLGYDGRKQVRLYAFRNRHGFTDAADEAFDRLWTSSELTWAEISRISDDAVSLRPV